MSLPSTKTDFGNTWSSVLWQGSEGGKSVPSCVHSGASWPTVVKDECALHTEIVAPPV
jgi:hypothetical protein